MVRHPDIVHGRDPANVTRLMTALAALHDGRGYTALVDHTDLVDLGGRSLRVLDLPTLIDIESGTGRAKDRLVVPVLLAPAKSRSAGPREVP